MNNFYKEYRKEQRAYDREQYDSKLSGKRINKLTK